MHNNKYPVMLTSREVTSVTVKCVGTQWEDSDKKY